MTVLSLAFFAAILHNGDFAADSYALKWEPKKGDRAEFVVKVTSKDSENPFEMESHLSQVVLKVDADGYETETESKGAIVRLSGEEIRDTRTNENEVEFTGRGAVKELRRGFTDTGQDTWMLAAIRAFVSPDKPVEIGGGWQYEYNATERFSGARISYTLKSVDAGMATVNFTINGLGRERPEIATGVWKINAETGEWRSMTCHARELFGSGEKGVDISIERTQK